MRLSLQKAAHANLSDAACRKSGSHQRTSADNDFFPKLSLHVSPEKGAWSVGFFHKDPEWQTNCLRIWAGRCAVVLSG
jgi:hypothetical protein